MHSDWSSYWSSDVTLCLGRPWYVQQASPASLSLSCAHSGAGSFCDGTKRVTLQAPGRSPTDTTPPGGREAEPGQLRMGQSEPRGGEVAAWSFHGRYVPPMIESYQQSRRINGSRPRGRFLLWEENISHAGQPERRLFVGRCPLLEAALGRPRWRTPRLSVGSGKTTEQ